jgi:peroxiredoxin family protein
MTDVVGQGSIEERLSALERELASLKACARSLSIVVFSGEFDKLYAAFTIATGAACMNIKVDMFFTFWGAHAITPFIGTHKPKGWLERAFGWLMPKGLGRLPLSRKNFWGAGPILMRVLMRSKNIEPLESLIGNARDLGVNFHLCDTSASMMGLELCLSEGTNRCGVSTFLSNAMESKVVLFI